MLIRNMMFLDLNHSFFETLENLAPINLTESKALDVAFSRLYVNGLFTLVAVEGEDVIGTASYFLEPKYIHGGGIVGHVEDVAVHPLQQGRGVGKALLEECIKRCEEAGCYKIILDCSPELAPWYSSLGFSQAGIQMRLDVETQVVPSGPTG